MHCGPGKGRAASTVSLLENEIKRTVLLDAFPEAAPLKEGKAGTRVQTRGVLDGMRRNYGKRGVRFIREDIL